MVKSNFSIKKSLALRGDLAPKPELITPLEVYMRSIARHPLLTPEEEYELAVKTFDDGSKEAAHRLVTANLRLVVKIAGEYNQTRLNILDLIQEGNFGLMRAIQKFNPYKGVKVSTYAAWWIKAYIIKYIMDNKSQVRMGTTAAQRKLFFNLRKEADKLMLEYDKVDTKLLAERLDVKEKDVLSMQLRLSAPDVSLDQRVGSEDETRTRADFIKSRVPDIADELAKKEIQDIFKGQLDDFKRTLKARDLEILETRILAESPLTLQATGDKYSVSRERARQLEAKIIKNLKDFLEKRNVLVEDLENT